MSTFPARNVFVAVLGFAIVAALAPTSARAQASDAPQPTQAQQDLAQQMQDVREQVLRNMIAQGINPRDFIDEVRQASPDGSFDLDIIRQKLLDKGLLDQQTIDRVEGTMQEVGTSTLKQQLNVTDDEWAALRPKIQKVVDASYAAGVPQQRLAALGFHRSGKVPSDVAKAMQDLRNASKSSTAKPEALADKLNAWRTAKQHAQEKYAAAQKELIEVLTRRQEAVLMDVGLLQ